VEAFINLTQHLAQAEKVDLPPESYIAANTQALEASFKLWHVAVHELDTMLQARIDHYKASRVRALVLTLAAVMASAVLVYFIIRSITHPLRQAVGLARQVSNGNLSMMSEAPSKDEIGQLLTALQSTTGKLAEILTEVRSAADSLSTASVQVLSTAQSLSQGTSDQAASMHESTVSLEQMSASITRNAEVSRQTTQMGLQGAQNAEACEQSVRETVAAMKAIAQKTAIIEDITNQTNLLAVNSAIEAARAGDQGRGFAVLAIEVRKLAERTRTAAQEISDLVSSSAQIAEYSSLRLIDLVPSIHKTVHLLQEVTAACNEQSVGVIQINQAISQMDQITQRHASAAQELATMAEVVASNAETLQKLIAFFRVTA
jgi:methyl-accepting chemotaxis protein